MPGLGTMLLPGKVGFADDSGWRFNPSYLPPQLATYFVRFGAPWPALRDSNLRLLLETAPKGFTPDWVRYEKGKGWQLKTEKPPIGSYDAIRVYLWVGMLHDGDKQKARLLQRFAPMAAQTTEQEYPGESEYRHRQNQRSGASGLLRGNAAVLQDDEARSVQRQRVADNYPGADAYYSAVLTLFGQGWDQHRFRFTASGELQPDWNRGMRKLSLSLLTLSLGVALLPLAQAATTPAKSICWSRSASARPAIVKTGAPVAVPSGAD